MLIYRCDGCRADADVPDGLGQVVVGLDAHAIYTAEHLCGGCQLRLRDAIAAVFAEDAGDAD